MPTFCKKNSLRLWLTPQPPPSEREATAPVNDKKAGFSIFFIIMQIVDCRTHRLQHELCKGLSSLSTNRLRLGNNIRRKTNGF